MPFDSLTFVLFLILVLGCDGVLRSDAARKNLLLGASWLFYAGWNPWFLPLLVLTASVDHWIGQRLIAANGQSDAPRRKRFWLLLSLLSNLGVLAYFKYRFFLAANVDALLGSSLLAALQNDTRAWVLPVGISFYTFQSMSYCIDCWHGQVRERTSWRDFMLYVAFFPQLVAGPIVRFVDFQPQLRTMRRPDAADRGVGAALLVFGLFLKVVLADAVFAPDADRLFQAGPAALSWWIAATGTLAFAGQIFCDFAGYSTCAIGCARLLGFRLPENFDAPYAAIGFSDFWRRWHVSLSSWLRDYLYISLGGNRHGALRTYVALCLTMLLGGLWHGAAWTFLTWGALHGAFLIFERLLRPWLAASGSQPAAWPLRGLGWLLTLLGVLLAWVFFRASSLDGALAIVAALLRPAAGFEPAQGVVWIGFVLLLGAHAAERRWRWSQRWTAWPLPLVGAALALLLAAVVLSPGNGRAFIYFQF